MGKGTFYGMVKATSDNNNNNFQFSVKVPETITHVKRLRINKDGDSSSNAMTAFEEFLDRIAPLKAANKLGAILFQLPPSFTVSEFRQVEGFLDRLPTTKGYDYAIEFRHPL
jgi:uncharacterized protein YecE (DUF72 family)